MEKLKSGKVWLVGAGPSDPGLLTIKGKYLLEEADVVVYDALVGQGILSMISPKARKIYVGKRSGFHSIAQEQINQILLEEAQKENKVVRLKGGDPFVFGRGGEELELLVGKNIPFEIVPGVTSAVSVAAYAGIPVTHRACSSSLHIITAHHTKDKDKNINYKALTEVGGTLVFLMGAAAITEISTGLLAAGMPAQTPAAIIENGTTSKQRKIIATVQTLSEKSTAAKIQSPAVIVVGEVCALSEKFAWAEKRPLGKTRILITRPQARASVMRQKLEDLGAEVLELPAIETIKIRENSKLYEAINSIKKYDWIAFTSPVGVEIFFEELASRRFDIRNLAGIKFAAIGAATAAAIESRGIFVDYVPIIYNAKELGRGLSKLINLNQKLLIPRAKDGSTELTAEFDFNKISYDDIPIYETKYISYAHEPAIELIKDKKIDYVAFTSASTVKGFVHYANQIDLSEITAICIGEQTAEEARKNNIRALVSQQATIDSMIDLILEYKK